MRLCLAVSLFTLGCASEGAVAPKPAHPETHPPAPHVDRSAPPPANAPSMVGAAVAKPLSAITLQGPFPTLDKACEAGASLAGSPYPGAPCVTTPISLGRDAPFQAALLHAKYTDHPMGASSGLFLLSFGRESGWYLVKKPLDQASGAAGKTYLPVVSLIAASEVDGRALFHFRDAVSSACNACEASEKNKLRAEKTTALVVACRYEPRGRPLCSDAIEVDEKASVKLAKGGIFTVTSPTGKIESYSF